jgi:hypothetical protein
VALIALTTLLAASGCSSGGGIAGPFQEPDDPGGPSTPVPGPAPAGYAIYAVDFNNRLLVFGSANPSVITRRKTITGLPILNRIVGIDFHPVNKKLYGVGNDSRVYVIDTLTAGATAVASAKFSPAISQFFDIHFGMGFEPATNRIRLISTESGASWSINAATGSAIMGKTPRYASGPHAGRTIKIIGLAYRPPAGTSTAALRAAAVRFASGGPCEDLMYAISAEYAEIIGSCDPDEGDFTSLGPIPGVTSVAGCGELKFDNGPGNLWKVIQDGAASLNKMGTVDPETGWVTWHGNVANDSPIQAMAFEPGGLYGPSNSVAAAREKSPAQPVAAARAGGSESSGLPACPGADGN